MFSKVALPRIHGHDLQKWHPELKDHFLDLLTPRNVHFLCSDLKTLFAHGATNRALINNQLRVFRGQCWNLVDSLHKDESPAELSRRTPLLLVRRHGRTAPNTASWHDWYRLREVDYSGRVCC